MGLIQKMTRWISAGKGCVLRKSEGRFYQVGLKGGGVGGLRLCLWVVKVLVRVSGGGGGRRWQEVIKKCEQVAGHQGRWGALFLLSITFQLLFNYFQLLSITTNYYQLPPITINYYQLLSY